ncbi:MGH1-like glycoside hydrolase domain-containing protein [Terrimonas ferruginea]|uniref:MGH1-like glycoside hydrolase domain-containing protein n=1 Tax=Terrimonas ferruginea TaxID=249 RepID=UPI000403C070|nr:glucosidase [Terrimonas ferruginea]
MTAEHQRLAVNATKAVPLAQWGPYLSERQWGTVREDYSNNGDAWHYFPFEHAHCRSYIWGEDGLAGISDFFGNLCFGISLWNGQDNILKERLFGLGNPQGNHGEDVKELYYYLDNLPTHYYMEFLYKYPQQAFPYEQLREENKKRSKQDPEYEILDTGVFNDNRYFDVKITYAKESAQDMFIRIDVTNRYSQAADLSLLPTLWFYNRWEQGAFRQKPCISYINKNSVKAEHERLGDYYFYFQNPDKLLFTENETNTEKVTGAPNKSIFVKDAFNDAIIEGKNVNELTARKAGTKVSPVYQLKINAGATKTVYCRLSSKQIDAPFARGFKDVFKVRKQEADEFYAAILPKGTDSEKANIQRQALAGILWSKQYYHFDVEEWLTQSDGITPVSASKMSGRNNDWKHLKNQDIIMMPDKWEYPWYAAWDLGFQCISMAVVDPTFAKHQLQLIMREWYMKPDGQLPAYEWNFSDVNPPVQAWAAMQIYHIEKKQTGKGDIQFLKKVFHKLLLNFTWWINRKDVNGNNIFEGGFLGLDNIGVFNRSFHFPGEMQLEQADGTSWMGIYALDMMDMAVEIALEDRSFEDMATKFFEHFVLIAESLNEHGLWNEEDRFFYDVLCVTGADPVPLRIQSVVGITPLYAVSTISKKAMDLLTDFKKRVTWFENYRKKNALFWPNEERSQDGEILLSLVPKDRLIDMLQRLLNEEEFLSEGGIRALSKYHDQHPYSVTVDGNIYSIRYDPGDSTSDMFGGNSNWRGPVWMPINFLIIQSIRRYGEFYGDSLKVEYPTGSGQHLNLEQVANELSLRVVNLFEKNEEGARTLYGDYSWFYKQPGNEELVMFYEYFHGDSGRGLGASHQTGWTALVAELISEIGERKETISDRSTAVPDKILE